MTSADGSLNLASSGDFHFTTSAAAGAETITITKATFNSRKGELKVEATSSLGDSFELTASFVAGDETGSLPMTYNDKKGKWSVTFTGTEVPDTKPESVTVTSTSGAFATTTDIGGKGNQR